MAMIGLPKSSSFMPVARHRPRAPAMLRPWVVVRERYGGMEQTSIKREIPSEMPHGTAGIKPGLRGAVFGPIASLGAGSLNPIPNPNRGMPRHELQDHRTGPRPPQPQ